MKKMLSIKGLRKRPYRLDHSRFYICIVAALFLTSISIVWDWDSKTPVFSGMGLMTENSMALILFLGAFGALVGMLSGTKFFKKETDIRDCYNIGKWSMIPVSISMFTYTIGVFYTYGIVWPPKFPHEILSAIFVASVWSAYDFHYEVKRIQTEMNIRINKYNERDL